MNGMTQGERKATSILASIFALRMLGLFMIIPVFALYGRALEGATPALIGLAIGIYGLAQAILQIPVGLWADRINRKLLIIIGLILIKSSTLIMSDSFIVIKYSINVSISFDCLNLSHSCFALILNIFDPNINPHILLIMSGELITLNCICGFESRFDDLVARFQKNNTKNADG